MKSTKRINLCKRVVQLEKENDILKSRVAYGIQVNVINNNLHKYSVSPMRNGWIFILLTP